MTSQEIEKINKLSRLQGKTQILLNEWANYMAEYVDTKNPSEKETKILFDKWNSVNELVQQIGVELQKMIS